MVKLKSRISYDGICPSKTASDIRLKWWTFPGGERCVKIEGDIKDVYDLTIRCDFMTNDDLIDSLLLVDAIRSINRKCEIHLLIPYFPYARQDRIMTEGEPHALRVAVNMIRSCNFSSVEVWDPHSDVLTGMFQPGELIIKEQADLVLENVEDVIGKNISLVSPDAGSLKKIYKLSALTNKPVIECSKIRDLKTGKIKETFVPDIPPEMKNLWIIDDICDGGRTFVEIAKIIKSRGDFSVNLYITHGIFSNGMDDLKKYIDKIVFANDMRR